MPVLALVSAKGSPGVTTAAAALAAAASLTGDSLLVELDPSGGDVQILTGVEDEPGVVLAATELRRQVSGGAVDAHVSVTPPGVPALLAPTAELMAASVIASVIERWRPALREYGGTVVVDAGRWDGAQATARRVAVGDLVAVVCRPSVASVEHARHIVDRLRTTARRPVVALVIGTRPYAPSEVATELEVPLGGAIAWDPRGVGTLWSKGVSKSWGRTWLASSAAQSLESLLDLVPDAIAQAPVSRTAGTGRRPLVAPGEPQTRASTPPPDEPAVATTGGEHATTDEPERVEPDSPPAGTPATGDGGGTGPDEPQAGPPEEPEAHDAGDGSPEGPEPSGRPGGDSPPASHPRPALTEAAERAGGTTGPQPPFPPPPPPPPAIPADDVAERPPVPPPPVPAHRSSAVGARTLETATPLAARAEAARERPAAAPGTAPSQALRTLSPPQAADPSTGHSVSVDEAGSVALAEAEAGAGAGAEQNDEDDERREPQTSFERFTLGRARQRARHADRAIATARLAGPATPGAAAAQAERVAEPADADEADADDSTPDRGTGKGAAQHSPPVRRGRRLNYGRARRDRS